MVLERKTAAGFGTTVRAVAIGVGSVPGEWLPHLPSPEREASALVAALQREDGCGASPDNVGPALIGPTCTRSAVLDRLREVFHASSPDDTIVVYFAGHGIAEENVFYLCVADTIQGDLAGSAVSGDDIGRLIENAQFRGVLLVLDCCYSAAAAEHAPAAFRSLRSGEFRLLLASARAGQRSWETADGNGTGFSTSLTEILEGSRVVGRGDGAIYFSDLIEGLEAGIEENRASRGLPAQEMVFAGTYTRDPLVFVMRGQTLKSVRFATARYSPRQLRRIAVRSAIILVCALFFCLVSWYAVLDATQFVDDDNGRLVAYRGHPSYSLPGYPRSIWSYAYGSERLAVGESRRLPIVAPLGKPVAPLLEARLDPLVVLSQKIAAGESTSALQSAQMLLERRDLPFETQLGARLLLTAVAGPEQIPLLVRWTGDQRSEIRLAALRGLLRLNPQRAVARALTDLAGGATGLDHSDILRRLQGTCTPDIERYFRKLAEIAGTSPSPTLVADAAVRVQCRLDQAFVSSLLTRMQYSDAAAVAGYAVWAGAVGTDVVAASKIELWRRLLFQAYLPQVQCDPSWEDALTSGQRSEVFPAILAVSRHCHVQLKIRWSNLTSTIRLSLEQDGKPPRDFDGLFPTAADVALLEEVLPLIAGIGERDVEKVRASISLSSDPGLRASLLNLLIVWGDRKGLLTSLLDSNSIELRTAYADYARLVAVGPLVDDLLTRIGNTDLFYTNLLGRIPLSPVALGRLDAMLQGTRNERGAAACVLAMQAAAQTVMALLESRDSDIREESADCVAYNQEAAAIAARLPKYMGQFAIESYPIIQQQVRLKSEFQAALAALPEEQRPWRLAIADTTPGAFGLWGRGMRNWFEEQRFQSKLTSNTR